jgi:hypothetical protein
MSTRHGGSSDAGLFACFFFGTQSLTSGILNGLGDQIAQTIQGVRRRDFVRSLKFGSPQKKKKKKKKV